MKSIAQKSSLVHARRRAVAGLRSGFTLLEVILALSLAVIVIGLVGNAVNGTLRFIDRGREKTERDQLARAVLTKIGNDVRGVVRYEPFDSKGMMSVKASSTSSKTGGSSNKGATKDKGTETGTQSSDTSGGSSSATSGSSGSSSTTTTTIAGVYGDQYRLQVDVGRLPNIYEYGAQSSDSASSATVPSDVKTVSYYLNGSSGAPTGAAIDGVGLVRTDLDRSAALYTTTTGSSPESEGAAVILAPEVSIIEFQYFDGTTWLTSWDSTASSGLPQSIKISVALATPSSTGETPAAPTSVADVAAQDPDSVYSLVVLLPARDATTVSSGAAATDTSSSSSSSSTQPAAK
jgi:prepilin-type N-terminal cleavage/methylation domain-containing protein